MGYHFTSNGFENLTSLWGDYSVHVKRSPGSERVLEVLGEIDEGIRAHVLRVLSNYQQIAVRTPVRIDDLKRYDEGERAPAEESVMELIAGRRVSIDQLLDDVYEQVMRLSEEVNVDDLCERINVLQMTVQGVLLPPGPNPAPLSIVPNPDSPERLDRFPKLGELIALLRDLEVYTDDLICIRGELNENQMRTESYVLVEIPRLNRSVLICNAYGEASFVYQGILSRQLVFELNKEELQERFGPKIQKVAFTHTDLVSWRDRMRVLLLTDFSEQIDAEDGNPPEPPTNSIGEKVDVRAQESFRQKILEVCPSPEAWMNMKKRKRKFAVFGKKLIALARIFGVEGDPVGNSSEMAELGRKIYGAGHECIECELWTSEEWREAIVEKCSSAEAWMAMKGKEKLEFAVFGKKLTALASIFGVEGDPVGNSSEMAELGRKIYGAGHECIECELWTSEEWREAIVEKCSSAEAWMGMSAKEKCTFEVSGKKLRALATIFGVEGNPVGNSSVMAELGRKIYGAGHACIDCEFWTSEQWSVKIREECLSAEAWMNMKYKRKRKFAVLGKKLIALARIFGVEGSPVKHTRVMAELGRRIYGEGHECIECEFWTSEEWGAKIREKCLSAEEWMVMNGKEKLEFAVFGKKLIALATFFGVKGNPVSNSRVMAELGRKIYGAGHECIECEFWTSEQWGVKIREKCTSPEAWMGMSAKDKKAFAMFGKKLNALATIFGVEGNPVNYSRVMAELGRRIYGDDPVFDNTCNMQ